MSITDELREWFKDRLFMGNGYAELTAIADRIDAEHERMLGDWDYWESTHVELPKDADGEYIHIGDVVTVDVLWGGRSKPLVVDRMELSHGKDGELWCIALDTDKECWNQPSLMHHHHAPTVEDVLREFAEGLGVPVADSYVAAAAAKLRLAEGEDA